MTNFLDPSENPLVQLYSELFTNRYRDDHFDNEKPFGIEWMTKGVIL